MVDKNLAALTISGFPTPTELFTAWADIQQEYADSIGDNEHRLYLSMLKDITWMSLKLQLIYDSVEILRNCFYEPFANRLNVLLNTSFDFDYTDPEAYTDDLNKCMRRSGGLKIALDLKNLQFEEMKKKANKPAGEVTRQYYHEFLIALSDHVKYQVQETITVFEFCTRVKNYNAYCEALNKTGKK